MSLLDPKLEAFLAIAQSKTVHAAAAQLHLTQTAVTQRIRALEQKLRTTLFIRSRRGMLLTTAGEALLRYCHAANELEGEALAQLQGGGVAAEVELVISAPSSITHTRVLPACQPIMQDYPNLLIHLAVNDVEERHLNLRRGDADFVILQPEDVAQEMVSKALKPEEYVLVCSPKWKGRKLKDIIREERIVDFDRSDRISLRYLAHFDLQDGAKHSRYFVNRTENIAHLVSAGIGYTTLTKEFAKPYLADNRLITLNKGQALAVQHCLAWYKRPEPAPYFSAIIKGIH